MNTSAALDVVIGLIFIFMVFSLAVSAINEAITKAMAWRSRHLWRTLRRLLDDDGDDLTQDPRPKASANEPVKRTDLLYAHPLIRQLEGRLPRENSPSRLARIPSGDFSRALIQVIVPGEEPKTMDKVRETAKNLPEVPLKGALLVILDDANVQLADVRQELEAWFDARMHALSVSYRRHVRYVLVAIGFLVAVAMNVDAIGATQRLYGDDALRTAISEHARGVVDSCQGEDDLSECTREQASEIDATLRLPVGWPDEDGVGITEVAGWLLAAVALS